MHSLLVGYYLGSKILKIRLRNIKYNFQQIAQSITSNSYDTRKRELVIPSQGYPFENYKVETEDGYILNLERLPQKQSKNVIYLQHGIMDSGFTWFAQNTESSALALLAYDLGYDVYVGTLRGCLNTGEHIKKNISSKDFWDFSVNEHAFMDIPAFIRKIKEIKMDELEISEEKMNEKEKPFKIAVVSHSMGSMATLMYIVNSRMKKIDHHLTTAILLSPAGYHQTAPLLCKLIGPLLSLFLKIFPNLIHSFRVPDKMRIILAKMGEDINHNTSTRGVISLLVSSILGGHYEEHAMTKTHNLPYHVFTGTSTKVFKHFWQIWKSQKFEAFDYGPAKNQEIYGSSTPINFFENYDKVDIPLYFVGGMRDPLIKPESITAHYNTLQKFHPELSFIKLFPMGHIDFTVGNKEALSSYIFKTLESIL